MGSMCVCVCAHASGLGRLIVHTSAQSGAACGRSRRQESRPHGLRFLTSLIVIDIVVLDPLVLIIIRIIEANSGIVFRETLSPILLILISSPTCPFRLLPLGFPFKPLFVIILALPFSLPLILQKSMQSLPDGAHVRVLPPSKFLLVLAPVTVQLHGGVDGLDEGLEPH